MKACPHVLECRVVFFVLLAGPMSRTLACSGTLLLWDGGRTINRWGLLYIGALLHVAGPLAASS